MTNAELIARARLLVRDAEVGDRPERTRMIADLIEALADAWDEGHRACDRDWALTGNLSAPEEYREPFTNPYRAVSA